MLLKVTEVKYIGEFKLSLTFNDGLKGSVDLQDHLHGPVFKPLLNEAEFKAFRLNRWTIEWKNGADFAPEFLHSLVKKQNSIVV